MIFESLLSDKDLMNGLIVDLEGEEECLSKSIILGDNASEDLSGTLSQKLRKLSDEALQGNDDAVNNLSIILASIILEHGRPALLVQENSFDPSRSKVWEAKLNEAKERIETILPAVGRIEVKNHFQFDWIGTGWLVEDEIIVTNRHVAKEFAVRKGEKFTFKVGKDDLLMEATMDFLEEKDNTQESTFCIKEILSIEPEDSVDIAFLRLSQNGIEGQSLPQPIELTLDTFLEQEIVTIGYPAYDSNPGVPKEIMRKIFDSTYNVKRLLPGKIKGIEEHILQHDCSTLHGTSGGALVSLETGKAVGIHFSGVYNEHRFNEAIDAETILERLAKL